jgi:hypothetical protein
MCTGMQVVFRFYPGLPSMFTTRSHLAILATALFAMWSCGEPTAPADDMTLEDALDRVTAGDALIPPMVGFGPAPVGVTGGPPDCEYNVTSQRFECADIARNGVTLSRYYVLLDATGAPQSAWSASVVAIRNVVDITGRLPLPPGLLSATVDYVGHDESTLSGLRSETQTLTGSGTTAITYAFADSSITSNSTRTTNLSLPRGPGGYPTGTISTSQTIAPGLTTESIITYNGTSVATIRVTHNGRESMTCTFDMAARSIPPVCSSPAVG